ncbi:kinase-like domain-containing protein [Melampsora americana]|nr:kinase-like domain-containing protein [Melampsora americana]
MPTYDGLPDHFVLLEKMGDGAFSNVYKAIDRRSNQKVAIKCVRKFELNRNQGKHLNADLKKKPRATERANILKEVSIMRTLNHPSIIKLISFTESKEHYFLVLELMEGGELFHQIVKLTYFSEELARHVILQVARGLRYLHEEKGVVHRDIKPENLLFESIPIVPSKQSKQRPYDEEKEDEGEFLPGVGGGGIGQVKIADFGLSKIVWAEETATPCGTRYSKSVDMWAMGCVLYTLLCGLARGYYTFLSPWWDDISASSKDLITHLLCVDPDKRYTIDEFLAHPWCKEKAPLPHMNKQDVATMAPHIQRAKDMNYAPRDSPLLHVAGGMRTPGVAQLREAFDVTYAVHRMEEEGARRTRYAGAGGGPNAGVLHGLNEEDEEEDEDEVPRTAKSAVKGQTTNPQQAQQYYEGWGGADRKVAEAALYSGQAGTRDRGTANTGRGGKRAGGFELNIGQATLLGRRNKPA